MSDKPLDAIGFDMSRGTGKHDFVAHKPPFETFKGAICRGSYTLGSACGRCERCEWERSRITGSPNPSDDTARDQAIREIESARWQKDEYGVLNLYVTGPQGLVHACLSLRPVYCDRGHIQLCINGLLDLDGNDRFPRHFFSFREADEHTRTFLKWRLWKHRSFPHVLEAP